MGPIYCIYKLYTGENDWMHNHRSIGTQRWLGSLVLLPSQRYTVLLVDLAGLNPVLRLNYNRFWTPWRGPPYSHSLGPPLPGVNSRGLMQCRFESINRAPAAQGRHNSFVSPASCTQSIIYIIIEKHLEKYNIMRRRQHLDWSKFASHRIRKTFRRSKRQRPEE